MGPDGSGNKLLAIEVDRENISKDLTALDIPLPILRPEWWRAHTLAQWISNELNSPSWMKMDFRPTVPSLFLSC